MTGTEYKNAITSAISEANQTADPISIIRTVLKNYDADFPYGDCRGILAALSENDFTGWRACTYEEAKKFTDEGVPTVGINTDQVILIAPDSGLKYDNDFVRQADSLTSDGELKFFAYSEPLSEKANDLGTTSDVPNNQTVDGFGGWYEPSSKNKGVTRRVPRFVQMNRGPCFAYSLMSGSYYMKNSSDTPESFFNNRIKNGYMNNNEDALWGSFTNIQAYSLSDMKSQLDLGKPVIVSGLNGSTPHYVLVVAYTLCGASNSNYVVIDPLKSADFPTTLADFKKRFPNSLTNSGITNPMFTYF